MSITFSIFRASDLYKVLTVRSNERSKMECPMSQADAEKIRKDQFMDKTKSNCDEQSRFVPDDGQLNKGNEMTPPIFQELGNRMSVVNLPKDIMLSIFLNLSTEEVLKCMQVCKAWKAIASEKYFWKSSIQQRFDLTLNTNFSNEGNMDKWSRPNPWTLSDYDARSFDLLKDTQWFCYYENEEDPYVIRPFPSMWNCGVVHPFGLDPMSGDVKSLQGLSRSLEILARIRKAISYFMFCCGNECSGNGGGDEISVVLFPWEEDELPTAADLLTKIFHFHPEICEEHMKNNPEDVESFRKEKLYFHVPNSLFMDGEYCISEDHDVEENPCLNSFFGCGYKEDESESLKLKSFFQWLQQIMVPSQTLYFGCDIINPVVMFFITQLAPGWVGGALTGQTWT